MKPLMTAFLAGILFALGLGIGGMTQPSKVVGFLDLFGNWDPSLIFVMLGAIVVNASLYPLIRKRSAPLFMPTFSIPTRKDVDLRLVGGAALFGIGWGLGGFCPGPAIVATASAQSMVLIFVAAMVAGMYLFQIVDRFLTTRPGMEPDSHRGLKTAVSH